MNAWIQRNEAKTLIINCEPHTKSERRGEKDEQLIKRWFPIISTIAVITCDQNVKILSDYRY